MLGRDVCRRRVRVLHPPCRLWTADKVNQPAEHCDTITATEAKLGGVGSQRVGERTGIVVHATQRVGDHPSHTCSQAVLRYRSGLAPFAVSELTS
jgi:hypothetical protein